MTTVFVNEHEYLKMVRAREDRIRTFMQLELEACLEEVRWSITCYNCEVLGCPQEEYPARLLPTLPPDYEVNLTNRLRAAQKGILPASLRMILNSEYPQSVLRYGSTSPLSPRHAAVVTRSEKVETPPKSPAISTGLDKPGISPAFGADTLQTDESFFPFEASTEDLLDEYVTSTNQDEPALLHQRDGEKETTTTEQAAAREESTRPTIRQLRTTASSSLQSKQFDRGRLKLTVLISD